MASNDSGELSVPRKLWEHPNPRGTAMWAFIQKLNEERKSSIENFDDLYNYSVSNIPDFWRRVWEFTPLIHEGGYSEVVDLTRPMGTLPPSPWFRGVRLNFAENILFSASAASPSLGSTAGKEDDKVALTEVREGCAEITHVTWAELRARVARLARAMRARGVKRGDRVAVVAGNGVDTCVTFLATTAVGGLFSSSSTDMGSRGILDRLRQVRPRWVFADDWAVYNGKRVDLRGKIREVVSGLEDVREFEGVVVLPRFGGRVDDLKGVEKAESLEDFVRSGGKGEAELQFERVEFADPFLIVYSSGTTGQPKCIVHSTGGVLIAGMKEGRIHRDLGPDTVQLQYTTTGWIMYLFAVQSLLFGARVILYDGSPFLPEPKAFIRLVGEQRVTNLGISPRYLQTLQQAGISPRAVTDLSALRCVNSTGMVLTDTLFEWFYDAAFPAHVWLANISGGTDLAGCFGMENPLVPVRVGGCQGFSLAVKVEVFDSTDEGGEGAEGATGRPVPDGVPGELVATAPFPNMPVYFWGDADHSRYRAAYFARFARAWTHGDFILVHPATRQVVFLGRADGVLNPSGVRFGSAELYAVLEGGEFAGEVRDAIAVGQRRPGDADEAVVLFLLMAEGRRFSTELVGRVKTAVARALSKRHVPKYVFETPEIPTTVNLKKVELPVKRILSGEKVTPSGTLLNPESLRFYYQFVDIEAAAAQMTEQQQAEGERWARAKL